MLISSAASESNDAFGMEVSTRSLTSKPACGDEQFHFSATDTSWTSLPQCQDSQNEPDLKLLTKIPLVPLVPRVFRTKKGETPRDHVGPHLQRVIFGGQLRRDFFQSS